MLKWEKLQCELSRRRGAVCCVSGSVPGRAAQSPVLPSLGWLLCFQLRNPTLPVSFLADYYF